MLAGHDYKSTERGVVNAVVNFVKENELELYIFNWDWWVEKR